MIRAQHPRIPKINNSFPCKCTFVWLYSTQLNIGLHLFCLYKKIRHHRDKTKLDEEALDLLLDAGDLGLELGALVDGDGAGHDGTGHAACTTQCLLGSDEHVRHVLVLAQQRQMEQDLQGLSVGGHHDELGQAAVQRLGGLVGSLAQLLVVHRLLDQVHDLRGERGVGQRECLRVNFLLWKGRDMVLAKHVQNTFKGVLWRNSNFIAYHFTAAVVGGS